MRSPVYHLPQPQPSSGSATYSLTRLPAISMSRWPETEQWVVLHEYHILVTRLLGWVLVNGVYVHEEGGFQKLPFPFPHHELRRPWQNQKSVPSWEAKQCPQESQKPTMEMTLEWGGGRPFSEETAPSYQLTPVFLGHFSAGARQGQVAVYQRACGFEVTQ